MRDSFGSAVFIAAANIDRDCNAGEAWHVLVRGILCCAAQYLPHAFNFLGSFGFGKENPNPTRADVALPYGKLDYKTPDGYEFYLNAGEKRLLSFLMKRDHLPRQAQDRQT